MLSNRNWFNFLQQQFRMGLFCFWFVFQWWQLSLMLDRSNQSPEAQNRTKIQCIGILTITTAGCCYSYMLLLYALSSCCVFLHTRASEHHGWLWQSSTKLQKCCLMLLTHFRVKCWGVFQHCPPGHLVIHLTSCFLLFFFPFLLLTVPHHCCKLEECTSPSKICLGVCPWKL